MKKLQLTFHHRLLKIVLIVANLLVSLGGQAEEIQVSPNGYSGLGVVPSASSLPVGSALVTFDPTLPGAKNTLGYNTQIGFGLYEGLELVGRLATNDQKCNMYKAGACPKDMIRDFSASFKWSLPIDWLKSHDASLALGMNDVGGAASYFKSYYVVGSKRLGAFDFNSRFYADDDLIVGAADPFQLFRIMHEVNINGGFDVGTPVSYVLDQCHNIEAKIPGQIRSIMNVQEAVAKAVLVDQSALKAAQRAGDVLAAHECLMDAYNTDVRGLLREWRSDKGIDPEPMKAYAASGYAAKIATERVGGNQAGWGA